MLNNLKKRYRKTVSRFLLDYLAKQQYFLDGRLTQLRSGVINAKRKIMSQCWNKAQRPRLNPTESFVQTKTKVIFFPDSAGYPASTEGGKFPAQVKSGTFEGERSFLLSCIKNPVDSL